MKKIKVVHIINNLEIGGAENFLGLLLEELSKNPQLELYLVCLTGGGPIEKRIQKLPVKTKIFNYHLFAPIINRLDPYFRFRLYFYLRKIRPDLIHGHLIRGESFAKRMGGLLQVPVITTSHDVMIRPRERELKLNRFLTKAVAVSKTVSDYLKETYFLAEQKITVIPNGIKLSDFGRSKKEFNQKKPVFLYVGRITETKGIRFAIEGLSKLLSDYPGLQFQIYGKEMFKGEQQKLEDLVSENKWDFVRFMGPTVDVPAALKQGDILVLPSKTEGFSMAVLEAAAAKKAVIATKTGAITEMIIDGKSGYFVNFGKAEEIEAVAEKLLKGNQVAEFGLSGYELVKDKFNIEKIGKMYYNLYRESVGNK